MGDDADLLSANKRYVEDNLKLLVPAATDLLWQREFGVSYTLSFSVGQKAYAVVFGWEDLQDDGTRGRLLRTLEDAVR